MSIECQYTKDANHIECEFRQVLFQPYGPWSTQELEDAKRKGVWSQRFDKHCKSQVGKPIPRAKGRATFRKQELAACKSKDIQALMDLLIADHQQSNAACYIQFAPPFTWKFEKVTTNQWRGVSPLPSKLDQERAKLYREMLQMPDCGQGTTVITLWRQATDAGWIMTQRRTPPPDATGKCRDLWNGHSEWRWLDDDPVPLKCTHM